MLWFRPAAFRRCIDRISVLRSNWSNFTAAFHLCIDRTSVLRSNWSNFNRHRRKPATKCGNLDLRLRATTKSRLEATRILVNRQNQRVDEDGNVIEERFVSDQSRVVGDIDALLYFYAVCRQFTVNVRRCNLTTTISDYQSALVLPTTVLWLPTYRSQLATKCCGHNSPECGVTQNWSDV